VVLGLAVDVMVLWPDGIVLGLALDGIVFVLGSRRHRFWAWQQTARY